MGTRQTGKTYLLKAFGAQGGKAEIDFLLEIKDRIVPLEVKSGINPRSRSLSSYGKQFSPAGLIRSNLLNLKQDATTFNNIPLYALALLAPPRLQALLPK